MFYVIELELEKAPLLLRNLDPPNGLLNGTRLRVVNLGTRVIEAEIMTGMNCISVVTEDNSTTTENIVYSR